MNTKLEKIMRRAWNDVSSLAGSRSVSYRHAAYRVAVERVKDAVELLGV